MFAIIGLVVVFGSVIGGFLLEKGNPLVLMQPCELLIIFGSALGTMLVANSPETILSIAKSLFGVTGGSPFTKDVYKRQLYVFFARNVHLSGHLVLWNTENHLVMLRTSNVAQDAP